jgi:two-component system, OmpR family, sensor histidine kinase KdpD
MGHFGLLPLMTISFTKKLKWKRYASDSLLALGSIFLLTNIIFFFQLPEKIPDSLSLYLLVVLALASTRGPYAALLGAFGAFFSFDFLFVPPLYSLITTKFSDFLTLIVFLATAIITSQLTATLRQYVTQARRREQETRILYDLLLATNREENMERQFQIFVQAVVEVFSPWGIRNCTLLLPDASDRLILRISASQEIKLLAEEEKKAEWVMLQGQTIDMYRNAFAPESVNRLVRLVPLKTEQKVLGVLLLLFEYGSQSLSIDQSLGTESRPSTPQSVFFRMFLEEAVALIERGRLQHENLRTQVLQQTDTLRAALLSSVSHDLRTPLAAIMTAATSLQHEETRLDEEAQQSLALVIEHEAKRLNRLVENLLDMSRIEGGALRPEKIWYPLDALVRDVVGRMYPLLQDRPLHLSLPEDLPAVELNYMQIDQVMTNLLENAVRYTPAGSPLDIEIQIRGVFIQISIADCGPGIPVAEKELIFDKFYRVQGKAYDTDHARGSGLGLAVCRGLIEAHGGRIWVESREGGGAVFCFTLPQNKTEGNEP